MARKNKMYQLSQTQMKPQFTVGKHSLNHNLLWGLLHTNRFNLIFLLSFQKRKELEVLFKLARGSSALTKLSCQFNQITLKS